VPRVDPAADVSTLWLETLQRLADRAAHEIKGALNGVALNVEVARSRSAKAGAAASAVAPFAAAAQQQLEVLTTQTEALLALVRPNRGRCDVGLLIGRFADLAEPIAKAAGGALRVALRADAGDATTRVAPEAVRLAIGAAVLAAIEAPARVSIEVTKGDEVVVVLRRDDGRPVRLPAEVAAAVADAGVRTDERSDEIRLAFAADGGAGIGDT
jgi:signal transduction histidine kinase